MQDVKTYIDKYQVLKSRKQGSNGTKEDRWLVRYKYYDENGKSHDSKKSGFTTKREATKFADSLKGDRVIVAPNKMSMNDLLNLWFDDYRSDDDLAENTILWHHYNLLYLRKELGAKKLQETDLAVINRFFEVLKEPQVKKNGKKIVLSKTSIKNIRRTLRQAFDFGVEKGYVLKNPLLAQKKKKSTKKSLDSQGSTFVATTIPQIRIIELIEKIEDPIFKLVIALAGLLGLRRGEIRGLSWGDIDFERKILNVRKQLHARASVRGNLKTPYSIRTLPLSDYVIGLLLTVEELQNQAKITHGEEKYSSNLIFLHLRDPKYIGKPYSTNFYSDSLENALIKNEFLPMRLHDLRHSFGSNLLYQGVDIITVSELMGHSSVAITLDVYAHVIKEHRAEKEKMINLNIEDTVNQYKDSSKSVELSNISPSNT